MIPNSPPTWQPIGRLSFFGGLIRETISDDESQLCNLREAEEKPWALDDKTTERLIRCYTERLELQPIYFGQVERWRKETLTSQQQQELDALESNLKRVTSLAETILATARKISEKTIDKILATSDMGVALDFLNG